MLNTIMKISKSNITVIATILFGVILLALQKPVTNAIVKKSEKKDAKFSSIYTIKNTYNLPEDLKEISGITWLNDNTFACIQDEDGIIYIYDIQQNKIKKKIKFAGSGDYEGIAIKKDDAYVMRSDGLVYEIKNYNSESREVSEFKTLFNVDNNIESLTFDLQNNRLLITPKDKDLGSKHIKSIYQIPILTKIMDSVPLIKINLKADILKDFKRKKIYKTVRPSDIAIHPLTHNIYVLEGANPKLLILNSNGELLNVYPLDDRKFAQPEGMTFSDDGRLFISNEATNYDANILEVEFNK